MKHFIIILSGILITIVVTACNAADYSGPNGSSLSFERDYGSNENILPEEWREVQRTDVAMGTIIRQNIYIDAEEANKLNTQTQEKEEGEENAHTMDVTKQDAQVAEAIIRLIIDLEEELLSYRLETSEIYRINQRAGQESEISADLAEILEEAEKVSEASNGALDITIGKVAELWEIDKWAGEGEAIGFLIPEESRLKSALADIGYDKIHLEGSRITLPENMKLDLGAVGKGIACERAKDYLEGREDIMGAVISIGGSVLVYGRKPNGSSWNVGIIHPREAGQYLGVLSLSGIWYVSTSGDYERYVEIDGFRYHHILDPASGYPTDSGVVSVTILSKSGFLSDALSTACFVLGVEKGLKLAEDFESHALIVDEDGIIHMTEGMEPFWRKY